MGRVYISCGFRDDERHLGDWGEEVLNPDYDVFWFGTGDTTSGPSFVKASELIPEADCLVAFVNDRDHGEIPPGVREEIAIAGHEGIPILAFWEKGISIGGMIPQIVVDRLQYSKAGTEAGAKLLLDKVKQIAKSATRDVYLQIVDDYGTWKDEHGNFWEKIRVVNDTDQLSTIHQVGAIISRNEVKQPHLKVLGGTSRELQVGQEIPPGIQEFYDVEQPTVRIHQPEDPLIPRGHCDVVVGYERIPDGQRPRSRTRFPKLGFWVILDNHPPIVKGYKTHRGVPLVEEMDGPPFSW